MKLSDYVKLAWGNLLHRRLRSWLTLLGIFVGVAAIVALIGLGQGLQTAIQEQFAGIGLNTLTIQGAGGTFGPPGTNTVGKLNNNDVELLSDINGVDIAFPRYIKATSLAYRDEVDIAFLASMPASKERAKIIELLNFDVAEGRLIDNQDRNQVTIGASVDINGENPQLGEKILINQETYRIAGIIEKKGNPAVDSAIIMSEDEMKELLNLDEDYSFIIASIDPEADINEVKAIAERTMRRDRGQDVSEEDFDISSPQETLEAFNSILITVQILLVGIAGISLLVGAIGILNTMYTAVLERRKEIGIMKAIGAKNKDILYIFLFESGLLGLTGGIIGLLLGVGISKLVEFIAYLSLGKTLIQATIPPWLIIGSLVFAFAIGALSGTLPAQQAAKLRPVDALRK
ncbi:ABC transporter permease [Candidatus Woesearchaeota archaeon]|nr:ABC transporter permease [Candidatus Woesearchaeota archaeon]